LRAAVVAAPRDGGAAAAPLRGAVAGDAAAAGAGAATPLGDALAAEAAGVAAEAADAA